MLLRQYTRYATWFRQGGVPKTLITDTGYKQIGDLGLGEIYNTRQRRDARKVWSRRMAGKDYLYTPEQFTEEWDWHTGAPAADGAPTAGNYRESMNVWQIGWVSEHLSQLLNMCMSLKANLTLRDRACTP